MKQQPPYKSRKWVKLGLYVAGGLVSAAIVRWLGNRNKQSIVSPLNPPVESYKPVVDITVYISLHTTR